MCLAPLQHCREGLLTQSSPLLREQQSSKNREKTGAYVRIESFAERERGYTEESSYRVSKHHTIFVACQHISQHTATFFSFKTSVRVIRKYYIVQQFMLKLCNILLSQKKEQARASSCHTERNSSVSDVSVYEQWQEKFNIHHPERKGKIETLNQNDNVFVLTAVLGTVHATNNSCVCGHVICSGGYLMCNDVKALSPGVMRENRHKWSLDLVERYFSFLLEKLYVGVVKTRQPNVREWTGIFVDIMMKNLAPTF